MRIFFLILFTINFLFLFSQDKHDLDFVSFNEKKTAEDTKFAFKVSFLFPSIGAEAKLIDKISLDFSTRLGINAGVNLVNNQPNYYFYPQPVFHIEPKWNYNILKRKSLGKNTSKFSSNFLSLHTSYNLKISNYTFNYLIVGPTWGLQRNFAKYGYFKFKTGLAYRHIFSSLNFKYLPIAVILNIQLGIIF